MPKNWANHPMHYMALAKEKKLWLETTIEYGRAARLLARQEPAREGDKHVVDIVLYKCGKFFDYEGAVSAVKPIVDGLKAYRRVRAPAGTVQVAGAGLIYDDDPGHIGQPIVRQMRVATRKQQCVVITIVKRGE